MIIIFPWNHVSRGCPVIKLRQVFENTWTELLGMCQNRFFFSNCKYVLEILKRSGCHPLDKILRSAEHCPAQSLLRHLSHAELQRRSERHFGHCVWGFRFQYWKANHFVKNHSPLQRLDTTFAPHLLLELLLKAPVWRSYLINDSQLPGLCLSRPQWGALSASSGVCFGFAPILGMYYYPAAPWVFPHYARPHGS